MASKKVHAVLSAGYVVLQAGTPLIAYAQSAGADLDLGSQDRSITAGSNVSNVAITIDGGGQKTFSAGDLLTPAEFVALTQVLSGGATAQTLNVASNGAALGGTFNLSTFASSAASIHIPQGVIGVSDAALGAINLSGNLSNSGTLYAISSNSNITSAVFSANNILNNQGALFSSMLPTTGLSGYTSVVSNLSLTLNAINDIINAGMISSAGALSLSAGGSIVNALPAGAVGVQPILQALGNVNMISAQLANAGMVNSLAGNINVNSHIAQSILINNVGGTLSALNGALNVRDASFDTGKFNLDIVGGDVLARELNLFSGNGKIDINVNELEGKINVLAHELAVAANTPTIRMGNVIVTGDPIITNSNGDVIIEPDSGEAFLTNGGPLIVTASRHIISTAGIIDTAGGEIVMNAGGIINLTATNLLNSKSASGLGGRITLSAVGGIFLSETGTVSSGSYITMDTPGSINAGNLVTSGNHGVILTAGGTIATGNITASSAIGGGVQIRSQQAGGASAFVVSVGENRNTNGVNGIINTTGLTGRAGLLYLNNGGVGDILIDPAFLDLTGAGQGGDLAIDAGEGKIIFNTGTVDLAGASGFRSGNVFLTGNEIQLNDTHFQLSGTNGGTFASSSNSFGGSGASAINSLGASNGGLIQVMSDDSLSVSATFNTTTGVQGLSVNGNVNYDTGLSINSSGSLQLNSKGTFSGGTIRVMGGDVVMETGAVQINASSTGNGNGGLVELDTASFSNTASTSISANGAGSGSGGSISLTTFSGASDLALGDSFSISADGGDSGNGGYIYLSLTGGITVSVDALTASAGENGAYGGSIELYAGTSGSGNITVDSTLNVSGAAGGGGSIILSSQNGSISLGQNSELMAGSDSGFGGAVFVSAGTNLLADGNISVSTTDGSAGLVNLSAGNSDLGTLTLNGNISASSSGSGDGGQVVMSYNSASQLVINGSIQANASAGQAGSLSINHSGDGNLNVVLNGTLSATADGVNGKINFNQSGHDVSVQGTGTIDGEFTASGASVTVAMSGNGQNLSIGDVSASAGSIAIHQSGTGSSLTVEEGRTIAAYGGNISIGAENITLENNTHLNMDSAGLLTLDSGSVAGNLTLTLPDGGTAFIAMTGGGGELRPGVVSISPRNSGNLTITGNGSLEVSGATVSASTSSGNLTLSDGSFITSDAFDELLGVGIEMISGSGNINLLGSVETSNLSLATLQGGSISLGADINSPTVNISTTGAGSITQTGGTIGIGSLILSTESGNVGSSQSAVNTNVLELKVTSGGDVFLSNDSDLDLKTSTVAGLLQLNNNGDISLESSVDADNLAITSTGSISIFQTANGTSSVTLTAGTSPITVNSDGSVTSTGDIRLTTGQLLVDGTVQSGSGSVAINSSGALVLRGEGSISASADGVQVTAVSLDIQSSFGFQASGGTVSMQADYILLGGTEQSTLRVLGNTTLAMTTSSLTLGHGSGIEASKLSGTAISVVSSGGLAVHLTASAGAQLTTGGGAILLQAGTGGNLVFDNGGQLLATDLNVSGGAMSTTSTAADTQFNGVNVVSDNNVFVNVHNGTVALGGDITSSNTEGVIALLDPNGLTVAGNGNLAFAGGGFGSIIVAATGSGNDLSFTGSHTFNSGVGGSISISSDSQITFSENSQLQLVYGQTSISAGTVAFENNASLNSDSSIALSGSGLNVITAGGGQSTITAANGVTVASSTGTQLTFATSSPGTDGVLAFFGGPVAIQSNGANVVVNANTVLTSDNNITVSTPGGTLINNGLIQTPNQGDTITVEASGNLLVDQNLSATNIIVRTISNNGNITLASNLSAVERLSVSAHGSGNILQTGGSLSATEIMLESGSGNIGSKSGAITFNAQSVRVSTSGSAYLQSTGSTSIDSAQVGNTLNMSSGGSLTVAASTSGPTVSVNKAELSSVGDMVLNGGIAANSASLKAHDGSITGSGLIQSSDLKLSAHDGNIGSALKPLNTSADRLTVQTTKSGSAFISESDAVSVEKVNVAGGFSLTSGGNLTVDDLKAKNGSISLVSFGSVQLVKNSKVNTDEGNILIQSKDTVNGTIRIGDNSKIEAFASAAPNGTVTVIIGDAPASWTKGSAPSNVSVSSKWGGQVYFGAKGIIASGKKNEINAWGSNVYFSVGSRPSSAIILEGNVKITADPPPAVSLPVASAAVTPTLAVPVALSPSFTPPAMAAPANTAYRTGQPLVGGVSLSAKVDSPPTNEQSGLSPVGAYTKLPISSPLAKRVAFLRNADIRQSETTRTSIHENGDLMLEEGQLIVQARKPLTVMAGSDIVRLTPGAVALINRTAEGNLEVFNLYESKSGAVQVVLKGQQPIVISAGNSLMVGDVAVSGVATRKHASSSLKDGRTLHTAEYSMLSLASKAEVVSNLLQSPERTSRQLVERLLKMAAALNMVTQSHGPFGKQ